MKPKCNWPIGQNESLAFEVVRENRSWNEQPGIYIFAREIESLKWNALYVGQTSNFAKRLPNHERLKEAVGHGATAIHARVIRSELERDRVEQALIERLNPQLNSIGRVPAG